MIKRLYNGKTVSSWDNSRFAVIQYSDRPRTEFLLNQHLTVEDVMNGIDAIPYMGN